MTRTRRWLVLALAAAAATLALTACGGSVSDGGTTTSTKTYTNDQYGFSITYGDTFTQGTAAEGTGKGGDSVLDIAFGDKGGPVVSDRYVNAVQVSVYELARSVKPAEVEQIEGELQNIVDQLIASLPGSTVVEQLSPITINGVPGFAFKYTYTEGGKEMTAATFFLFKDNHEYQITAQAVTSDWDSLKGELERAVQSFTVR
jgi:hypothetical protein